MKPERTPNETSLKSLLSVALQTFAVAHRPLVLATDAVETLVEMQNLAQYPLPEAWPPKKQLS